MSVEIHQVKSDDIELMNDLLTKFGEVFNDMNTYTTKRPSSDYMYRLLSGDSFVAIVALEDKEVVDGLAAYDLKKFEQERSEFYIYDLAVSPTYRRKGIATALIEKLKTIAAERGAYIIFVQADTGIEDEPAIALYTKLGVCEDVLHFDISVNQQNENA